MVVVFGGVSVLVTFADTVGEAFGDADEVIEAAVIDVVGDTDGTEAVD